MKNKLKNVLLLLSVVFLFNCSDDDDDINMNNTAVHDPINSDTTVVDSIQFGLFDNTITHNSIAREYLLYVPRIYDSTQTVPMVFSLHGAGGSKESQYQLSEFNLIADRENFIVITPEATGRGALTFWNQTSSANGADDVGFIDTLISVIAAEYNVDLDRIYLAGSSNGAFMSLQIACERSNKIAAVAAVKGYMTPDQITNCNPSMPTAIIQMHGTQDPLVAYNGIQATIDFWNTFNQTDTVPTITNFPDTDPNNGNTANSMLYRNGTNGIEVEHIEVVNGMHDWFGEPGTNYDFSASEEAWRFFDKFDVNGLR